MKIIGTVLNHDDTQRYYIDLDVQLDDNDWRNFYAGMAIATHLNDGNPDRAGAYAKDIAESVVKAVADSREK